MGPSKRLDKIEAEVTKRTKANPSLTRTSVFREFEKACHAAYVAKQDKTLTADMLDKLQALADKVV